PFLFDKVTSTWKLNFNQVDLELGRKFWLSKHMDMRVYAGSRGAWFNTKFNNQALSKTASDVYVLNRFIDYFKDRMWGVGLLAGLQPQWHVNRYFFIFSNLDAALLFGKFRVHKKEDYTSFDSTGLQSINYHNNSRGVFNHMQAVLDIALGVRWEDTWCYKVRSSVDVAWENHIWFDDNHRYKINSAHVTTSSGVETVNAISFQNYEEVAGNLIMGGLVIRARVDF
ncbi:MAG TPA: Lpg1974 family pore-forming outer membrane protein, partial [Chlamydiales bacterium]|nr:Lpg1974 family pore-forming outer membrane protein [Chlamydiales bacterium]